MTTPTLRQRNRLARIMGWVIFLFLVSAAGWMLRNTGNIYYEGILVGIVGMALLFNVNLYWQRGAFTPTDERIPLTVLDDEQNTSPGDILHISK